MEPGSMRTESSELSGEEGFLNSYSTYNRRENMKISALSSKF